MGRVAAAVLSQPFEKRQADPFGLGGDPAGSSMRVQQESEPSTALRSSGTRRSSSVAGAWG
jgi:hypothetical protein